MTLKIIVAHRLAERPPPGRAPVFHEFHLSHQFLKARVASHICHDGTPDGPCPTYKALILAPQVFQRLKGDFRVAETGCKFRERGCSEKIPGDALITQLLWQRRSRCYRIVQKRFIRGIGRGDQRCGGLQSTRASASQQNLLQVIAAQGLF
jgi:hypothetical protein